MHIALTLALSSYAQNYKLDSLLKSFGSGRADTLKIKSALRISTVYLGKGLADSATYYGRLSFAMSKKAGFLRGLGSACNYLGQACNYNGKSDSAIYFFTEAMNYYKQARDVKRESGMLNNLAIVYEDKGNIPKALDYYFLALKLKEQQHDSAGIANGFHNIGQLYSDAGDTANALKYYKQALKIRRATNDLSGIGASLIAVGTFNQNQNNFVTAREQFTEALHIAEQLGEEESIAIACYNLGNIYYKQGTLNLARELYHRSLNISKKNDNVKGIAVCLEILGQLNLEEKHYAEAITQLEEAYGLARNMESLELLGGIAAKLSVAHENSGNHKRALFLLKEAEAVQDTLFSKENIRKITAEGLKYEHEREQLIKQNEQEKKESIARAEAQKKNIILSVAILFIVVISFFSYSLYKKLKENQRQKKIIEEQKNELVSSINYAQRIQYALLTQSSFLKEHLPQHFVLFKPKDIVSGDFYWAALKNDFFYIAVCDSTGHGVPGAFMSLLNINYLNEALNENIELPGKILDHVRRRLIENMSGGRDGMDAILVKFPAKKTAPFKMDYAAANNTPMVVRNNELLFLERDKMPVGQGEIINAFATYSFELFENDSLYLYTDGYADQFGGEQGKKFKYKPLNAMLLTNSGKNMDEQSKLLLSNFETWRGPHEQVDDVCVVGVKF